MIFFNRYKDNQEFYQYIPSNRPPKRQYHLEGIYLDVSVKETVIYSVGHCHTDKHNMYYI